MEMSRPSVYAPSLYALSLYAPVPPLCLRPLPLRG
jgi:hypothetical protein